MKRDEAVWVLQVALLNWDGITEKELLGLGATPKQIQRGIKLCDFLKNN